jgi:hypothetical protein
MPSMSVWYLDLDDEITDAVARLRAAADERVVLVVPPGSRIATGRINFRLLSREARSRDLALAIVSPDAQVRALAAAAGLLAHGTVADAESALERGDSPPPPAPPEGVLAREEGDEPGEGAAAVLFVEGPERSIPAGETRWQSRRVRFGALASLAIGLLAIGGVASVTVLPTASIAIAPSTRAVGPIAVAVTADPSAVEVDAAAGLVPAQRLEVPLSVSGAFRASGIQTTETRATGEVRFRADGEPIEDVISVRTRVSTPDGVEFDTTRTVTLEPSDSSPGEYVAVAPVQAVLPGPQGNVPAGAITVQEALASLGISVSNPEPTSGGTREETPVVTEDDYDSAVVDLQNRLTGQFADRLADPETVPEGLTLFPETAVRGESTHRPPAAEVVGQPIERFELASEAAGSVLAVEEGLVEAVARTRLVEEAPTGSLLLDRTVSVEAGRGTASGGVVRYAAIAQGRAVTVVDVDELLLEVSGKPIDEARSILEGYGDIEITVWPDFVGRLPDDTGRIDVTILGPRMSD